MLLAVKSSFTPRVLRPFVCGLLHSSTAIAITAYFNISCVAAQIRAEDKEAEAVTITVRTIEATQPISADEQGQPAQSVESPLEDLKSKLQEIPYKNFRLVSSKEERFCLKKRQSMQLPNGQALSFRPIYMDGKKVGLWINWKDHDGAQILDTRLHFNSDDSVITGTDHVTGSGTVLAIKAEPIHRKNEPVVQ